MEKLKKRRIIVYFLGAWTVFLLRSKQTPLTGAFNAIKISTLSAKNIMVSAIKFFNPFKH